MASARAHFSVALILVSSFMPFVFLSVFFASCSCLLVSLWFPPLGAFFFFYHIRMPRLRGCDARQLGRAYQLRCPRQCRPPERRATSAPFAAAVPVSCSHGYPASHGTNGHGLPRPSFPIDCPLPSPNPHLSAAKRPRQPPTAAARTPPPRGGGGTHHTSSWRSPVRPATVCATPCMPADFPLHTEHGTRQRARGRRGRGRNGGGGNGIRRRLRRPLHTTPAEPASSDAGAAAAAAVAAPTRVAAPRG